MLTLNQLHSLLYFHGLCAPRNITFEVQKCAWLHLTLVEKLVKKMFCSTAGQIWSFASVLLAAFFTVTAEINIKQEVFCKKASTVCLRASFFPPKNEFDQTTGSSGRHSNKISTDLNELHLLSKGFFVAKDIFIPHFGLRGCN